MANVQYVLYFDGVGKVSEKAVEILVDVDGKLNHIWLPKSQCNFFKKGAQYKVELPAWLFFKNGFDAENWDGTHKFTWNKL